MDPFAIIALYVLLMSTVFSSLGLAVATPPAQSALKPEIIIVPGSWLSSVHFQPVITDLIGKGYNAVAPTLPNFNSSYPEFDTVETDTRFLRDQVLLPCINAGKDVVLAVHSYAGIPGGAAAYGLGSRPNWWNRWFDLSVFLRNQRRRDACKHLS